MRFLLHRLAFFALTLWAAVTVNFLIPRLMPGDPASAMMVAMSRSLSNAASWPKSPLPTSGAAG